jgi:predicted dehydrogenase
VSTTKPLSVGVIGCGGIAQMMHLPTLAERPDLFRIAGLADMSKTVLDAVGERYGVSFRTTDPRELVTRAELDAVLVLHSGSHLDSVVLALGAHKHVFSEKPLGIGFSELRQISEAAKKSRGKLMVGYHKRFDPAYQRAREAVRAIEGLRWVQVTVLHPDDNVYRAHHALLPWKPFIEPPEAVSNAGLLEQIAGAPFAGLLDEIAGKDAPLPHRVASFLLYDSLLHDIDAVRGMLGEPDEVLSAHAWNDGFAQSSLTRFGKDIRVALNWISVPGLRHYEETLIFVGPKSRVKLVFPSPYLRHAPTPLVIERMEGDELVEEHRTVSYEEAFRAEIHQFRRMVLDGGEPSPSLEDAVRDAEWIQAISDAYRGAPAPVKRRL